MRVRRRGVPKKPGDGDLLFTVQVAVSTELDDTARAALEAHAATRSGLPTPGRAPGGQTPLLGPRHLTAARGVSQDEGVYLAGVERITELESRVDALRLRMAADDDG